MPKSLQSLNQITVSAPCNADWSSMRGNRGVRFCEHCNLHVTDLSSLTQREAMRLVERSRGRLCVRYVRLSSGEILTSGSTKLHQIGRRISRLAASAFTATLSLSSVVAQSPSPRDESKLVRNLTRANDNETTLSSNISGVITDPNKAVILGAVVILTSTATGSETVMTSTEDGKYDFKNLAAGSYKLSITSPGFKTLTVT